VPVPVPVLACESGVAGRGETVGLRVTPPKPRRDLNIRDLRVDLGNPAALGDELELMGCASKGRNGLTALHTVKAAQKYIDIS
jgi:hypothetical protein